MPASSPRRARHDGILVLRTNARITPLNAVLRYRELLMVEALFRAAKATLDTRPIFHSCDAAIRGHVFCSFLALILAKELQGRCARAGFQPEWERPGARPRPAPERRHREGQQAHHRSHAG